MNDRAVARRTDPRTSHEAAASVGDLRENQRAVLRVLRENPPGLLDEQLIDAYAAAVAEGRVPRQSESSIRTRRRELVDIGLVRNSSYTARMRSGRQGTLWEVVPDWEVETQRKIQERHRREAAERATEVPQATAEETALSLEALLQIEDIAMKLPPVGFAADVQHILKKWRKSRGE